MKTLRKRLFLSLPLALVILLGCGGTAGSQNRAEPSEAPGFRLRDMEGRWVNLADFRGRVIILDFWTTWCPPCRKEIPDFVELLNQYGKEGLTILGVSLDKNPDKVLPGFIERYRINYPILLTDGKIDRVYGGIRAIPTTFIIDRRGRIRQKFVGMRPKRVFEEEVKRLLSET